MADHDHFETIPRPSLLFRQGLGDPLLYALIACVGWLIYVMADEGRNLQLEQEIGYSGTRLGLIAFVIAIIYGTVQGMRQQLVVYINDETTPGYSDALVTFLIVVGTPLCLIAVGVMAYAGIHLMAPAGFAPPRLEYVGAWLLGIIWGLGILWMYARLYAYNRGALSAFVALLTKLTWCLLAVQFLFRVGSTSTDGNGEEGANNASGFFASLVLFVVAILVIEDLTYEGPSLRDE